VWEDQGRITFDRPKNRRRGLLHTCERLRERLAVAAIQVNVVSARRPNIQTDGFADDEGDGLRFEFTRVT
jgi:hypothetical protein